MDPFEALDPYFHSNDPEFLTGDSTEPTIPLYNAAYAMYENSVNSRQQSDQGSIYSSTSNTVPGSRTSVALGTPPSSRPSHEGSKRSGQYSHPQLKRQRPSDLSTGFRGSIGIPEQDSLEKTFFEFCNALNIDSISALPMHGETTLNIQPEMMELSKNASATDPFVCNEVESMLMTHFINEVAPLMDCYCASPIFSSLLPKLAAFDGSGLILNCIYACSALFLHYLKPQEFDIKFCLRFHNAALQQLRVKIGDISKINALCLVASVLLNFESQMFDEFQKETDENVSPMHNNKTYGSWILFMDVLSEFIQAQKIANLETDSFVQTCFWTIISHEYLLCIKSHKPTFFAMRSHSHNPEVAFQFHADPISPVEKSVEHIVHDFFSPYDIDLSMLSPDSFHAKDSTWWLHLSIFNLLQNNNFVNHPYVETHNDFANDKITKYWLHLKRRNEDFAVCLPETCKKIINVPADNKERMFPRIMLCDTQSTLIFLNHHLSCILLYVGLFRTSVLRCGNTPLDSPATDLNEFLTHPKNVTNLLRFHSTEIIGCLLTQSDHHLMLINTVGHFKMAVKYLNPADTEDSKELSEYQNNLYNKFG